MSSYNIRNYQPTDFDQYTQLVTTAEKLEPAGLCVSRGLLQHSLNRPNYSPEQDLFVIETAGSIVGYMDVIRELRIGRVIFDCLIHPEHRRQGLATRLIGCAMHRAQELGARLAHVNILQDNVVARSALSRLDFKFVRRFLQMRLNISKVRWQDNSQTGVEYRSLRPGEEGKLTQLQNSAFAGTWGYNPNTVDEIIFYINAGNSSPQDIILAWEGDRAIAYCWTRVICKPGADEDRGQVFMLGVDAEHRGKGIGRGILLAGLSHLKDKGLNVVELTVDSENKVACPLYQSLGFKTWTDSLWYEKAVA